MSRNRSGYFKSININRYWKSVCFLVFAMFFACNTSGKEDAAQDNGSSTGKEDTAQHKGSPEAWYVTIRGKVANPLTGKIVIQEMKDNSTPGWQDTVQLKSDKTFSKRIKLIEPGYYKLNFYNKQVLNVILDKDDIEVNVDGGNPQGFFEVKGSRDLDFIREVQTILKGVESSPEMARLNEEYAVAIEKKDEQKILELQKQGQATYQAIESREHSKVAALIEKQPPSLAVINLLQNNAIDKDKYFPTYLKVADKLRAEWPDYTQARAFVESVDKMKVLAIGQPAPEIALPDPNGKIVKLSSLKGKYVLVDFWAKWCGPCRQENPNVVRVYNKYKDKGFTVYGVSLDRRKEDWLQAIEQDGLTWTHVSDLKYWQSEAAKTYNISAIPFSVLVDPEGIIVDKNLRGQALEKRISELLDKH